MSFKVGDKVICINGGNWSTVEIKPTGDLNKIQDKAPGPEKDDILTIAFIHSDVKHRRQPAIILSRHQV